MAQNAPAQEMAEMRKLLSDLQDKHQSHWSQRQSMPAWHQTGLNLTSFLQLALIVLSLIFLEAAESQSANQCGLKLGEVAVSAGAFCAIGAVGAVAGLVSSLSKSRATTISALVLI